MTKILAIILFACSCSAADIVLGIGAPASFSGTGTNLVAQWGSSAPVNPMLAYSRPSDIVGFWHGKHSGGLGVQRTNTGSNSNVWTDLSSGGHDLTLSDYAMTESSGWGANGILACDGNVGSVAGTYQLGNTTNMTILVVLKARTTGFQSVFEHNVGIRNTGALAVFISDQGQSGILYDEIWATGGTYELVRDAPPINAPDFSDDTVLMANHSIVNSGDTSTYFLYGYLDYLELTRANYDVSAFNVLSGNFKLGCRYDGSAKLNGKIAMLAIWNTILTASEISNNVTVAKQQFGF